MNASISFNVTNWNDHVGVSVIGANYIPSEGRREKAVTNGSSYLVL